MKRTFTISPKEPDLKLHATRGKQALLIGIDEHGHINVLWNQKMFSVVGRLYLVVREKKMDGRNVVVMKQAHETAGYRGNARHEDRIPCFHAGSGKRFMLHAKRPATQAEACHNADHGCAQRSRSATNRQSAFSTDSALLSFDVEPTRVKQAAQAAQAIRPIDSRQQTRRARQKLTLEQEQVLLQRIGIAQSNGVEIFLVVEEVGCWLKLSVASIYRKARQKRFPSPTKREKSSVWSLSSLLAYQYGTWKPDAA